MKEYIKIAITIYLFFCITLIQSQNIVPNSSFENGSVSYPSGHSQVPYLYYWENFETSDWYSSSPNHYGGVYDIPGTQGQFIAEMVAKTGDKYVGFGHCEGLQVNLTKTIKKNDIVKISFWWSPRHERNTEINYFLSKNKADANTALNDCSNPNISSEFMGKVIVNAGGANPIHIPGKWYYYESESFKITDEEYNWFVIKGENIAGTFNSVGYIYLDDVSVFSVAECAHLCTPKEPVNFYQIQGSPNVLATAMIGNSAANWFMLIENASNVEFTVFNRWGLEVYNYKAYDPNGLKDIGYNDYAFEWNGHDNNGNALSQGLYNFNLEIKNCKFRLNYIAQPLFILSCSCTPVINYPYKTKWLKNCCKENAVLDNITFPNGFREDVNDFIMAGVNNPTIVDYGTKVDFYAGQSIILGTGFQSYGNFTAEITPCGTFNMKKINRHSNLITHSQIDSIYDTYNISRNSLNNLKFPNIFPNPTSNNINITQLNNFVGSNIEIINLMGQVIFTTTINSNQLSVNLSKHPKGIYLVKINSDKEQLIEKIVLE